MKVLLEYGSAMETSEIYQFLMVVLERYKSSAIRGVVILGSLYVIFWMFKRPWMDKYRVPTVAGQQPKPLKEILLTYTTYMVYAILGGVVYLVHKKTGHTMMYTDVAQYGWAYTVLSVPLFLFYSDTTFYWSHIFMHKTKLGYMAHLPHHQFVNVTPWAAYAFGVGEALISASTFMLLMLLVPWHPMALFVYVVLSVSYNGMIHLGYDFFPKSWRTNPVLKWMNSPTHHIYHHQKLNCNYSFIFTFWDKIMKTERLPDMVSTNAPVKKKTTSLISDWQSQESTL